MTSRILRESEQDDNLCIHLVRRRGRLFPVMMTRGVDLRAKEPEVGSWR